MVPVTLYPRKRAHGRRDTPADNIEAMRYGGEGGEDGRRLEEEESVWVWEGRE